MQYNFVIFLVIENILVLFYHSSHNHLEKINLYNLAKFYLLSNEFLLIHTHQDLLQTPHRLF